MDNELFIKLLSQHNRLTIPSFGTFLKKEQAGNSIIVFTPFLKSDDGVLSHAIAENLGVEIDEAQNIISQYVEVVKTCLDTNSKFFMDELGTLKYDMNGALSFVYEPRTVKVEPKVEPPQLAIVEPEPVIIEQPEPISAPTPPPPPRPTPTPASRPMSQANRPISTPSQPLKTPLVAAPPAPRPIVKRPVPTAEQGQQPQRQRPPMKRANPATGKVQKIKNLPKTDIWLLIAIVAAILVIILIIYGYMNQDPEILLNPEVEEIVMDTVTQVVR